MTEKETLGRSPLSILRRKLSKTGIAVIALVVVIIVGGITASYITLRPSTSSPSPTSTASPSPSPSPTPTSSSTPTPTSSPTPTPSSTPTSSSTPTPTPSPTPTLTFTHIVNCTTMMTGSEIDYWNVSASSGYNLTLTDSMKVSNESQQLGIWAENSSDSNTQQWIWNVNYMNSTFAYYWVNTGGGNGPQGNISCVNSVVNVVVTSTSIEFIGSSSATINTSFQSIGQIQTTNGDDNSFTGGNLVMTLSVT